MEDCGRGNWEAVCSCWPAGAYLQEGAPSELRARDSPGPGPVDRVEDPLYDLQEEAGLGPRPGAAGPRAASRGRPPHTAGQAGEGGGGARPGGVPRGCPQPPQGPAQTTLRRTPLSGEGVAWTGAEGGSLTAGFCKDQL